MNTSSAPITEQIKHLLGEEGYAQAFAPIDQASGLPNAAYWSGDWLALENKRIFQRGWVFVMADAELEGPGAIKPAEVGGTPIMLVRGADGKVRAFHNVCRHRGTQLVGEACQATTITCPYHAWAYRLDGSLKSRPHFHGPNQLERFDNGEAEDLTLHPIRCETWNGCHFVNISGDAPDLTAWMGPMLKRTSAFDFSDIRWIGKKAYSIKSNWKLVLENYMEGYHVFAAHPRLIAHAPMDVRWSGEWEGDVFYNDYVAPEITEGRGDGLPHYPNLSNEDSRRGLWFVSNEDSRRGLWFVCMPNFAVEVYADQFVVLATYPVAPDETYEELHFFVVGDEAASSEKYAQGRDELIAMWHDLNLEDVDLLERLQLGRRSVAFDGSIMSPAWEGPAHELAGQVIRAIERE